MINDEADQTRLNLFVIKKGNERYCRKGRKRLAVDVPLVIVTAFSQHIYARFKGGFDTVLEDTARK